MKTIVSLVLAIVAFNSTPASAFQVFGNVQVTQNYASGQFCNQWNGPVYCSVNTTGIMQTGQYVYAYANMFLAPGQCDYAYVYANYPYYFVNANASGNCEFQ